MKEFDYGEGLASLDTGAFKMLETAEIPAYSREEIEELKEDFTYEERKRKRNQDNPLKNTEEETYLVVDFRNDTTADKLVQIAHEKLEEISELDGKTRDLHAKKTYEQTVKAVGKAVGEYIHKLEEENDVDGVYTEPWFNFGGHFGGGSMDDVGLKMVRHHLPDNPEIDQEDLYGEGPIVENSREGTGIAHQTVSREARIDTDRVKRART